MMYPLVREPAAAAAAHRVPVVVTCRLLGLARQAYYRWLARPVTDAELTEAYRADALFDAHRVDPEFGHRFLLDEAHAAGEPMAERTAWRICRQDYRCLVLAVGVCGACEHSLSLIGARFTTLRLEADSALGVCQQGARTVGGGLGSVIQERRLRGNRDARLAL
ncbi:hypothetical protein [Streptomyces sp. NPDC059278]|uniref:hypothetical protein n=1 Tax=Streptomyces sp. NPDC059278 TaxID=3346801 RepID=UPI00367BDC79